MARNPHVPPGEVDFDDVIRAEIEAINRRRAAQATGGDDGRPLLERPLLSDDIGYSDGRRVVDAVGLSLSGGGIRSAAFSLGALQALNQHDVIRHIDYLSTVSGGGYIGSALTATISVTKGKFAFGENSARTGAPRASDIADTPAVFHIRNYSNYLIPFGVRDVLTGAAIIVRGLAANLGVILAVMLMAAAITVAAIESDLFGRLPDTVLGGGFRLTLAAAAAGLGIFFLWALYRSFLPPENLAEFRTRLPAWAGGYLVFVAAVAFCELQPFILSEMLRAAGERSLAVEDNASSPTGGLIGWVVANWIETLAAITAPVGAIVALFNHRFAKAIETGTSTSKWTARLLGLGARASVWVAGAALPLLIWVGYLYLSFWGIANDAPGAVALVYSLAGVVLLLVAMLLRPNANSLHRLYRDRLSKAFLFDPHNRIVDGGVAGNRDLQPLDTFRLSDLANRYPPYHLIGAALNIHGSDYANRRGRNADFFLFSPGYVGSFATGYAPTAMMEAQAPELDLATAVAISGAAASSNMGSQSIRALTPTLALLNVRLGFWLKNPYVVYRDPDPLTVRQSPYFLWAEITGRLYEDSNVVYLTDGGHIENLGIYELLRRKCRLIVAVDGEGDPKMRFNSFVALQRYARIDLGIRIGLPWKDIAECSCAWMGVGSDARPGSGRAPTCGPHVAVGRIDYGGGETGNLVYLKASLSGDENDYIGDYARRYRAFPHESTGDQFFTEEQFEVYRALGFHAMHGFLAGRDDVVAHPDLVPSAAAPPPLAGAAVSTTPFTGSVTVPAGHPDLGQLRAMLGLL